MVKDKGRVSDEKATASSYIINFYNEIVLLNQYYSLYDNLLIELNAKYGQDGLVEGGGDKELLFRTVQEVRYHARLAYLQYKSIISSNSTKLVEDVTITNNFERLKKDLIIDSDLLSAFVISLNSVLITEVMKGLLKSSQDIVSNVFQDDTSK